MAKINILTSNVYNRIAAGEVVDRPYSVVKELVENSLDAGATEITITVERGGKELICVADNGSGIERDDLNSAFMPHATSKIATAQDLDVITTLGFRGEALPSIASVSNVRIRSKAAGSEEAFELTCSGGAVGEVMPCALGSGTEISVENLFFNTPVRARFLKTDRSEESEISNCVARFVLGNPNVSFRFYLNGKLALQSFGGGLEEAVAAVYGGGVIAQCNKIDATKNGIHIHGYLGKPSFTKANRTYQSTFINGRYVVNGTVQSSVMNAYGSYLMKRQYPFYVLFIDVPPEIVDVNVHPNKADVRFENNQVIYGSIYSVVSAVLDGSAAALEFVVDLPKEPNCSVPKESDLTQNKQVSQPQMPNNHSFMNAGSSHKTEEAIQPSFSGNAWAEQERAKKDPLDQILEYGTPKSEQNYTVGEFTKEYNRLNGESDKITFYDSGSVAGKLSAQRPFAEQIQTEETNEQPKDSGVFEENQRYIAAMEQKAKQQKIIFETAEFKGELFRTYLLYEMGDSVYIIDQHAAHERLIFNRLKEAMDAREVVQQPMLVPYILNVNKEEFAFLSEHTDAMEQIGFEIEEFGTDCFKISAVPADLCDIDLEAFFADVLHEVGSLRGIRLTEILRDKLATTACKHAVKGGMRLTESEKDKLFEMLHGDMGLKCPHGRPIAVHMTKTEIEKLFKRIV